MNRALALADLDIEDHNLPPAERKDNLDMKILVISKELHFSDKESHPAESSEAGYYNIS